jgi:beta-glucanase (GH16 family)
VADTKKLALEPAPEGGGPRRPRRTLVVLVALAAVVVLAVVVGVALRVGRTGSTAPNSGPTTTITGGASATNAPSQSAADQFNWPMVAQDDFGPNGNPDNWDIYHGRTTGDVGRQSPNNIDVNDGILSIVGKGKVSGGMAWKNGQTYGRWEIRARIEPAAGYGPVLLLWPDSGKWPEDGEIDFLEIPDAARNVNHFTVHYGNDNTQDSTDQSGDFSQWHDYAVEWEPDHITGWIDGKQVFHTTNAAEIPRTPMHLAMQLDIGPIDNWIPAPNSSTPSSVSFQVDWVHIYGP